MTRLYSLLLLVLLSALLPTAAQAGDRLFTYTYETPVIQPGDVELEPWLTTTLGKDHYYFRLDHRMELEWGIAPGIQTALYLNFRVQAEDVDGTMVKETKFRGFSSEWKFSVLDPVADPLGLGFYLEFGVQPHEVEFEGKVLIDKVIGPVVLAFNAVGEAEIKPQPGGADPEVEAKLIFLLGAAARIGKHFAIGAEIREMNVFEHGELEHAWLHAGPAVHVRGERVWGTLTVLPQLVDLKSGRHDMESGAALEARLLVGVHF